MRALTRTFRYVRSARAVNITRRASHSSLTDNALQIDTITTNHFTDTREAPANVRDRNKPFKLKPLNHETCTRVLTVHPSSDKTAPVVLDVEEIDLAGSYAPFVAISHVWGSNPRHERFALCNGKPRPITSRVDSLLHRIRNKISEDDRYQHWRRIWIDTLCIDQTDNETARLEKNHQVSIMHKIFGDAHEVIVDLGAADRYTYLLPTAKQDIALLQKKAFDDEYCKDILGFPSSVKVEAGEAQRVRKSLEACSRLLDKQWMCRIWAVQEYALARKSTFLSGHIVIDGDLLVELGILASEANIRGRSHLSMLFSRFRRALALTKLPTLAAVREQGSKGTKMLGFGESLGLGWHHDCSDERDTVYAMRALVDYRGNPMTVDYNEPSNMLARRVSRKLIELGDFEAVLAGARGLTKSSTAKEPSWSFLIRPPFKFIGEERHWILSGKPNKFRAGGVSTADMPPLIFQSGGGDCLEATIHSIGTLTAVGEKLPQIPQYGSNPKLPVERLYAYNTERTIHTRAVIIDAWLRHTIPDLNRARRTKHLDRRSDEVWRTITHGHNGMEFETRNVDVQQRIDYWVMLIDMSVKGLEALGYQRQQCNTLASDIRALEDAMRKRHLLIAELVRKPQEWIDEVHHEFDLIGDPRTKGIARLRSKAKALSEQTSRGATLSHEQILKQVALNTYLVNEAFDIRRVRAMDQLKMLERRLGILQDGRLVSLPHLADTGDIIAVFRGISVPYVLRNNGEDYNIIGSAYVDNIMHGEAVSEEIAWQKIQIT